MHTMVYISFNLKEESRRKPLHFTANFTESPHQESAIWVWCSHSSEHFQATIIFTTMGVNTTEHHQFICVSLLANMLASVLGMTSRQGFFTSLDGDFSEVSSSKTVVLTTMDAPSDLACSQKCFADNKCAFKSFDTITKTCELYQSISVARIRHRVQISKKVTAKNACDTKDCGERCKCRSLLGTEEYSCDCHVEGLNKTSSGYVHNNCKEALAANGDANGSYLVQPMLKRGVISVVCEIGKDNISYAVFNHDKQDEVTVEGGTDDCGSNVFKLQYFTLFDSILLVMNVSSHCQQKTSAHCKNVWFIHRDCTWLLGRSNTKLSFWGGGPQDGKGCACGITGTCSDPGRVCNCDREDGKWQSDEGYVTKRDVLPLAGIKIGDVGNSGEAVIFTIGPLKCVF